MSCGWQSRSLDRFWALTTGPTAAASRCSWVTRCMGGAWFVTWMTPWCTLGLASPETGEARWERLVWFVQFELKLSHHTSTSRFLHLHVSMKTFCPQVTKGAKEPGQFVLVCMWHFEDRKRFSELSADSSHWQKPDSAFCYHQQATSALSGGLHCTAIATYKTYVFSNPEICRF